MRKQMKNIIRTALVALIFAIFPITSNAVIGTCEWDAPLTGTPVVVYRIELSVNDGEWVFIGETAELFFDTDLEPNVSYRARVQGVDAEGHVGPYSLPSDPYTYGSPGSPSMCRIRM